MSNISGTWATRVYQMEDMGLPEVAEPSSRNDTLLLELVLALVAHFFFFFSFWV